MWASADALTLLHGTTSSGFSLVVREPPVKLCFLSIRRGRDRVMFRNVVPERLRQLKLLFHAELTSLINKIRIHWQSIDLFSAFFLFEVQAPVGRVSFVPRAAASQHNRTAVGCKAVRITGPRTGSARGTPS